MSPILSISIYDLHYILRRFVRLYRQVQVVSDCLTFACSMLCCQCWAMLPENPMDADQKSSQGVLFLPQHLIDAKKAGGDPLEQQNLFIGYKEDTEEVQEKCIQFWKMVNSDPKLMASNNPDNPVNETYLMDQVATTSRHNMISQGNALPAVHNKLVNKNGASKPQITNSRISVTKHS